jgi:hypothetical protein
MSMQVNGPTPNPNINTQQSHKAEAKNQNVGGVQFNEFIKDMVKQDIKKVSDNEKAGNAGIHDNKEWIEREGGYTTDEEHIKDLLKEIEKAVEKDKDKK